MLDILNAATGLLERQGEDVNDPWDIVDIFEKRVAEFAGSKYAVSVDSCTNAMFLCLKYLEIEGQDITIPDRTYVSVPGIIKHTGNNVKFEDIEWEGVYQLGGTPVYDSATRFRSEMYIPGAYQCLSFHAKKNLAIGKGGMILTNDEEAYNWFKIARYEGRHTDVKYADDHFDMIGWNMYMYPEQAAYGLMLFEALDVGLAPFQDEIPDCGGSEDYRPLSSFDIFK